MILKFPLRRRLLYLLLNASLNNQDSSLKLSVLYGSLLYNRKLLLKYDMIKIRNLRMPIPLSIYPKLADYYYENHEYASALFYMNH